MRETVMALACKRVSTRGGGLLGLREVWSLCREKWFEILWAEGSERAEVEEGVEEDLGCFLRVGSMDVLGSEASKMHLWVGWRGILWINEGKWWKPGCLGGVWLGGGGVQWIWTYVMSHGFLCLVYGLPYAAAAATEEEERSVLRSVDCYLLTFSPTRIGILFIHF